jgi:hypothetical protein
LSSKRRTQYSTIRGASPKRGLTPGQLIPWDTSNILSWGWSCRDSYEQHISSFNPRAIVDAPLMVRDFMKKRII